MTFNEILDELRELTEEFTIESGSYRVEDKGDVRKAVNILNKYYINVDPKHLDYKNNEADGIDYLIEYDTPSNEIGESMRVNESLGEAIEKHDELNPKLWDGQTLKPEVESKLREIVQKFDDNLKENEVELDVKDICIIGSNANYNYSPDSDIDLHIVADTSVYPDQEDLAMKVYLAYKSLFNNKYDPTINGIEVEIYVEPDAIQANSNGIYSLDNGWLKEPEQVDVPEIDPDHVQELIQPYEDRYTQLISGDPTVEDVDKLIDDIYLQRQSSIMKDGEFGDGNICFKEFRNRGYLQSLRDLKVELENKEMSLNDMNEQLLGIYGLNEDCDDINEGLTEDDLFVGAEFTNPNTGSKIVITGIDDDLVTYDDTLDGVESVTITDPINYFVATLNEYDYVLDENCNKELKEDIFENENGMEISFPDPRDTLAVFLEWEGIMGYTDEIYDVAQRGYDELDEFLEYEGILGYTSKIYEIVNTGSAWCSQMEMEDFLSVCRSLYLDYSLAINDDDIEESVGIPGGPYEDDADYIAEFNPDYDNGLPDPDEIPFDNDLTEAKKVGLVAAAKSALNKYCDKLKDKSAEEIFNHALEHASKSEYPFVKDNLTAKKDVAIEYINKRKDAMSVNESGDLYLGSKTNLNRADRDRFFRTVPKYRVKDKRTGKSFTVQWARWDSIDDVKKEYPEDKYEVKLVEDFVIDDKPGTKYKNKNGIILKMEEPTENGEIQFAIIDNGEIIDHRKMSDLKSFSRMIDANGYEKLNEDTVKQGDKWVNKGKEGTHGKFKTKKAADDQRKAMFANGYHESLDEGTAFDSMPGYMSPEEIRAFNREKEAKAKAEKDAVRAEKKAAAKERAKAEREHQKRIDQREKVNSLSYDSLADMAGLEEDNNDLTKDELLAVLRANMSDEEILKLHKKMFEDLDETADSPLNEDTDFTNKAAALSEYLDIEPSDISDTPEENVFEVGDSGQEYFVGTEEEAHAKAVEEIKMLFDDMGLDSFTKNFQDEILRDCIDESAVDEFIESELDYFRNDDPDEGMVNYLENLTDKVEYIKDTLGPDSFASWAKDKIDLDAMADEAIRQDGEAHFIAYYDGNEIDLGHGLFAYRMN